MKQALFLFWGSQVQNFHESSQAHQRTPTSSSSSLLGQGAAISGSSFPVPIRPPSPLDTQGCVQPHTLSSPSLTKAAVAQQSKVLPLRHVHLQFEICKSCKIMQSTRVKAFQLPNFNSQTLQLAFLPPIFLEVNFHPQASARFRIGLPFPVRRPHEGDDRRFIAGQALGETSESIGRSHRSKAVESEAVPQKLKSCAWQRKTCFFVLGKPMVFLGFWGGL